MKKIVLAMACVAISHAESSAIGPNPIISRGKPVYANLNSGTASLVNDGIYYDAWRPGNITPANPAWIAINVGTGYSRLLLIWDNNADWNYTDSQWGPPGNYKIQVSPDSTNGSDGSWQDVVTCTQNAVHSRGHSFDFTGNSWVRLYISSKSTLCDEVQGVIIDEIDIHDVSSGISDTWFFMGDSITAGSFLKTPAIQPSFADNIEAYNPAYHPAMIDAGIGGDKSSDGLNKIDNWLSDNPDMKYWTLSYGTNDAGESISTATYKSNMQAMINKVKAIGANPIIPRIPHCYYTDVNRDIPIYNAVVDELVQENNLILGPDLYAYFLAHEDELLPDGVHPNDTGSQSINRLWADAMKNVLYSTGTAIPSFTLSTSALNFGEVPKKTVKTMQFNIYVSGSDSLSGTISSDADWIVVDPASFTGNTTVTVAVNPAALAEGSQNTGTVTVNSGAETETITVTVTPTCVVAYPNPFRLASGSAMTFSGSGVPFSVIKIYTISGNLVKTIINGSAGTASTWDGNNESGNLVAPGIYIYCAKNPVEKNTGRFTVIR